MGGAGVPPYYIAVSVVVPLLVLVLLGIALYACCSRRYRLNWYEKTLLEHGQVSSVGGQAGTSQRSADSSSGKSHSGSGHFTAPGTAATVEAGTEKSPINCMPVEPYASCKVTVQHVSFDEEGSSISSGGGGGGNGREGPIGSSGPPQKKRLSISGVFTTTSCTPKYVLLTPDADSVTSASSGAGSMGAWNSSIGSLDSEQAAARRSSLQVHSMDDREQFWVPPTVVQKKRAQSLIPHLGLMQQSQEEAENGSPSRTPLCKSSTSLQEMMFSYPAEKLTETVSPVQVPGGGTYQRRRRASMQDALDHTKINARLYSAESPTPETVESVETSPEEGVSSVNFSLLYDQEQALLTVRLIQARNLVARDFSGTADPYARLCLLPNRRIQLQSKVHRKTLCPEFEEEFIFEVTPTNLPRAKLQILLLDYDQFSRDECIGEAVLPLEHVDLSERLILWRTVLPHEQSKEESEELGDIMFSLGYLSSAERLTVVVMKARNLKAADDTRATPSPLVKVSLMCAGRRLKKKKTSTKRNTPNPVWNEALVFSLGKEFLSNSTIEFLIYNDNLLGNSDPIGRVVIGPQSTGDDLAHWNDVVNSKNAMARWHHLTSLSESGS